MQTQREAARLHAQSSLSVQFRLGSRSVKRDNAVILKHLEICG